jgi:hypothetical protein
MLSLRDEIYSGRERVTRINKLSQISEVVVEAAGDNLVIGLA